MNADNTALTDRQGYVIYYGTNAADLAQSAPVNNPSATSHVISKLPAGTYYFSMTTLSATGGESDRSAVVSKTIP